MRKGSDLVATYGGVLLLVPTGLVVALVLEIMPFPLLKVVLPDASAETITGGDAEKGRGLFNGKGICHYCHGQNGDPDNLPALEPETLRIIRGLRPQPPDLRRPAELKLKTDKQRFRIIREGHEGTGMFPDATLSNQDIRDVLAYLATLRGPHEQSVN
ncbi:MAG TPA: cytochrome c [Nitrospiraceae bacterium]|nr:cytochrome c [Nitrospiraceae bacterium]